MGLQRLSYHHLVSSPGLKWHLAHSGRLGRNLNLQLIQSFVVQNSNNRGDQLGLIQ
jgi:hypothetical protein